MKYVNKYMKRPITIEAIQFEDYAEVLSELSEWLTDLDTLTIDYKTNKPYLKIKTLEGVMTAQIGDFIIKGIKGEFYPCKPDIFKQTYDKVDNDSNQNSMPDLIEENKQLKYRLQRSPYGDNKDELEQAIEFMKFEITCLQRQNTRLTDQNNRLINMLQQHLFPNMDVNAIKQIFNK